MASRSFFEPRPFLYFIAGPKNRLRRRVRGGGAKPRESAAEHGQSLLRQIEAIQTLVTTQQSNRPASLPDLPEGVQVIVESKRFPAERAGSLGLTPIEERADGVLVTISPNPTLATLAGKAQSYVSERTDRGNPRFEGVIAPIDNIRPAGRSDRVGERLARWMAAGQLRPDQLLWVDVELAGGQTDLGQQNRQEFFDYVHGLETWLPAYAEQVVTATSHFIVEPDYSLHRVLLPAQAIEDLLDNSQATWLLSIDLIPAVEEAVMTLPETADGTLRPLPVLAYDAPRVVIVDSGIVAGHPLFRDEAGRSIIGRQVNFLPESAEPRDLTADEVEAGHGTAVASVAAFGSVKDFVLNGAANSTPVFWVENAKILLPATKLDPPGPANQPQLHPAQLPKALMREVIAAFHEPMPRTCKIFNLSLGSDPHHLPAMSNWAEELDNLSANHDVLFVVPTGDLQPEEMAALIAEVGDYPDYLFDQRARLRNPAQAHSALAVGAITDSSNPMPLWKSGRALAPAGHPAPFSRSGLLTDGLVKPDVVEVGGNLGRDGSSSEFKSMPELAVLVANRNFADQADQPPLAFQYGTDLAAPRVSHLAGRIQARYPEASANLIRALIVNSAEWPEPFISALAEGGGPIPRDSVRNIIRLCGYGAPQALKALSANSHCLVFVAEDEFSWTEADRTSSHRYPAKVSFFSIHFEADDLFRLPASTQVRLSITLAYNPPVRKTQRRHYQGIQMRWDLKRQDESSEEFRARWMAEAAEENDGEDEANEETIPSPARPWPWQLKPVINPGGRVRRGTVIRDWFDIFAHELPQTLEIVTLAAAAPWRRPPEPIRQPYALVVSIESLDPAIPLYDVVRVQSPPASP